MERTSESVLPLRFFAIQRMTNFVQDNSQGQKLMQALQDQSNSRLTHCVGQ